MSELSSNIFELIEFSVDRQMGDGTIVKGIYGVNVAKVREVVRMPKINPLIGNIPGLAGLFELRGIPIPAIDLAVALGDREISFSENQQIIVTEFSRKRAGFIVGSTHRIRRIAWDKVMSPASDNNAAINGMTLIEDNEFLFIIDLERILLNIEKCAKMYKQSNHNDDSSGNVGVGSSVNSSAREITVPKELVGGGETVLVVDDSKIILSSVKFALQKANYNILTANDGHQAQDILKKFIDKDQSVPRIDCVVSDVEMPRMDGFTLTKWIKDDDSKIATMPVILHTSLSGNANQEKGINMGAEGYVIKNDINELLRLLKQSLADPLAVSD